MLLIKNAEIVLEDRTINGNLSIENGRIKEICPHEIPTGPDDTILDASGSMLVPGFIDLHTHGAGGRDYMDGEAEDIIIAAKTEMAHGATTILPTTLTSSDEDLFLFFENFKKARKETSLMPDLPGVHLEGPYFDMVEKGAQDARYIRAPEKSHYMEILEKSDGCIKRWSFAPELQGSMEFMKDMEKENILLSAAHTAATYEDISRAYDQGLRMLTHFYSGMSTITRKGGYRILGTVESGYIFTDMNVELIADGIHLPPPLLQMIFKLKDYKYITACTDSMRGAGMGDGPSILGPKNNGQEVIVEDVIAKMPDRTCFAGSVATAERLFRTLHRISRLPAWVASYMTSLHPAQLIGEDKDKGSIKVGKLADLVILDSELNARTVIKNGEIFKGGTL